MSMLIDSQVVNNPQEARHTPENLLALQHSQSCFYIAPTERRLASLSANSVELRANYFMPSI